MNDKKDVKILNYPILNIPGLIIFPNNSEYVILSDQKSIDSINNIIDNYDGYFILSHDDKEDFKNLQNIHKIDINNASSLGSFCSIKGNKILSQNKIRIQSLFKIGIEQIYVENNILLAKAREVLTSYGNQEEENNLVDNIFSLLENVKFNNLLNLNFELLNKKFNKGVTSIELVYFLPSICNFSIQEKKELFNIINVNEQLEFIINVLNKKIFEKNIDHNINLSVRNNSEKNQKEYYLREKLKAIKKELGEDDDFNNSSSILERIEKENFPDNIKIKIKDELKKIDILPPGSLEASLIKNYIDLLLDLPWNKKTEDEDNLKNVEKVLNKNHSGLQKPKERILEYIAVKKATNSLKAPIICFYGPPGTGKTSLAKSIANALNRKFVKCSLGGVSDEAEIRGFKRTYVGSAPGNIVKALKNSQVNNPVILLDEIDKLDKSYKGNPASALLEVLDPEQNTHFVDNFIEEPIDLSNILFICTANYLDNIPAPLLDRLELIELNSYTSIEKNNIAQKYLIPKALKNSGLEEGSVVFNDETIDYIIDRYTRESGVRQLERNLNSIARKICIKKLKNKIKEFPVDIQIKDVPKMLGIEIFESTKKEKGSQVGVVTGLAYTEYGGDILPIEVNYFQGKGELILTGKLGEVMKESCSIALDYIKSNADKYNINHDFFNKNDIHVHVPEGAVPKDGPSAGVAITIAIISSILQKPVSGDIAMTGEVTLRGNALAIGGLREKVLAALRSGIKLVIVPKANKNNILDLPKEITSKIEIQYMESVDNAIKLIFKE
ncbi:MAG: endopeptidase La [Bacillales bacterium]